MYISIRIYKESLCCCVGCVACVGGEGAARVNTKTLNTLCTLKVPGSIARKGMHGFWAG